MNCFDLPELIGMVKREYGITMFIEFDNFGITMRGYRNGWKNRRYFDCTFKSYDNVGLGQLVGIFISDFKKEEN